MKRRYVRGLTLVELVVTLAVVAVLAAVAIPNLIRFAVKYRLEGVANELRTDLQYARTEAIRLREGVSLTVNNAGTGYTISGATSGTTLKTVSLPSGAALSSGASIGFESLRGMASITGQITATASGTSDSLRISVDSIGRVNTCAVSGSFYGVGNSC